MNQEVHVQFGVPGARPARSLVFKVDESLALPDVRAATEAAIRTLHPEAEGIEILKTNPTRTEEGIPIPGHPGVQLLGEAHS